MIKITENADIRQMTTFGLPAECGRLVEYDTIDDLLTLFAEGVLPQNTLPIGGGSNLLFTTGHFHGTILHCTNRTITISAPNALGNVMVDVAAGCVLDDLCFQTCQNHLWGLENLSGIPGEIGGAAVQNVGAYGVEFKDVAHKIHYFNPADGTTGTFTADDCNYGYRDSIFKHAAKHLIITGVQLQLTTTPTPRLGYAALATQFKEQIHSQQLSPMQLRHTVITMRDSKLPSPTTVGSAGSFFKNPIISAEIHAQMEQRLNRSIPGHKLASGEVKLSAAWLIDQAGCKSLTHGAAKVWQQQPLVIVNSDGTATGADIVALENAIRQKVSDIFGTDLTPEVVHI